MPLCGQEIGKVYGKLTVAQADTGREITKVVFPCAGMVVPAAQGEAVAWRPLQSGGQPDFAHFFGETSRRIGEGAEHGTED